MFLLTLILSMYQYTIILVNFTKQVNKDPIIINAAKRKL